MSDPDDGAPMPSPAAPATGLDAGPTLAAWRERGVHRRDPVRFRFIEALARRAAIHHGAARRVLDGKLAQALQAYGAQFDCAQAEVRAEVPIEIRPQAGEAARGPLGELVHALTAGVAAPTELKTLRQFRSTWSRLSTDQRLSQSRAAVPDHAGPLHSHALVLRSLTLMRELSPDYLSRFMAYADALLWLEQAHGGPAAVGQDVVRAARDKPRKASRSRPG